MSAHPIQWQAPRPLWARYTTTSASAVAAADPERPAILRFASDEFMEQILGTLACDSSRIDALVARAETWREPMAEPADLVERTPKSPMALTGIRKMLAEKLKTGVTATRHAADDPRAKSQTPTLPLKLYQPAHQRYYLLAASLICDIPGSPERALVSGKSEQVNYVIRRLLPATPESTEDLPEFAYVKSAQGGRWQRVNEDTGQFFDGEELLPVFPLTYRDNRESVAHMRTLWAGFVPVGRREEYVSANVDSSTVPKSSAGQRQAPEITEPPGAPVSKLARVTQFQMEVAEPWKNLIRSSYKTAESLASPNLGGDSESLFDKYKRVFEFNLQQQNVSWLILLDFADFLSLHLEDVWRAIETGDTAPLEQLTQRKALYEWLGNALMSAGLKNALKLPDTGSVQRAPAQSLRAALKAVRAPGVREKLERIELNYTNNSVSLNHADWPDFHFILAGLNVDRSPDGPFKLLGSAGTQASSEFLADPTQPSSTQQQTGVEVDRLTALVGRALEAKLETGAPPLPFALQLKNSLAANLASHPGDPGWFVARFVLTRPECGPLHPPVLSAPTQRFQLASFFDADAPARPIRISLPMDTSPAGLRKYSKNTAFVLSDMLCGQVQRAKSLGFVDLVLSVLPWPFHKDLDLGAGGPCKTGSIDIGMICSLSIPIITICALILLMIIVSLLDFIFRWIPYFIMCFPVPGLKGKK
ncbi:MAG: hypothetical protein IH606_00690 [Burkholderiales bacterium]|nr:hypothetical protein [Burkholderiales bacterium]